MSDTTIPTFLDQEATAKLLLLSERTLERLRVEGGGPAFRKFGRKVAYSLTDVLEWADSCKRVSTSDGKAA